MSVKWSTKSTCEYCSHVNQQSAICEECGKFQYMRTHPRADAHAVAKIKDLIRDAGVQDHIQLSMQILEALDYNFPVEIVEDDR